MKNVICIAKQVGETPLEAIVKFKKSNPTYKSTKISYAGRLDPMADGLLLLLVGEENKKRKQYENLKKTYEFSVVFGITSDSYDRLGRISVSQSRNLYTEDKLRNAIKLISILTSQSYPPYSSRTVHGKPLYWWAREKRLDEIELPTRNILITKFEINYISTSTGEEIAKESIKRISQVNGEFRQKEILDDWRNFREKHAHEKFSVATITLECTSGTYVRGLTHTIGEMIGCGALALSITRTSVGNFKL